MVALEQRKGTPHLLKGTLLLHHIPGLILSNKARSKAKLSFKLSPRQNCFNCFYNITDFKKKPCLFHVET